MEDLIIAARFKQMRKAAKRCRKIVPSIEILVDLAATIQADGMRCPICRRVMNWTLAECPATVVTLQHDRDGTIRLMCKGCNSKHAQLPGDSFYDIPVGHKRCPKCSNVKPEEEFYVIRGKPFWLCKLCSRTQALERYRADPVKANQRSAAWKKANRKRESEKERLRQLRKRQSARFEQMNAGDNGQLGKVL